VESLPIYAEILISWWEIGLGIILVSSLLFLLVMGIGNVIKVLAKRLG